MLPRCKKRATSQAEMAPWDALPPEIKDIVFAALSLLELGRAAPTSREFRSAYKARLAVGHAAALQKGAYVYGEAFLKAHSTVILRLFWGVDLFSGGMYGGIRWEVFHILKDGTLKQGHPPEGKSFISLPSLVDEHEFFRPAPIIPPKENRRDHHLGDMWPHYFSTTPPIGPFRQSLFSLKCYLAGDYICIHMACRVSGAVAAAGALAVMCKHIKEESGRPTPQQQGQALKLAIQLEIGLNGYRSLGNLLSEAHLDAIAAALLPLFPCMQVLKFLCSPPGMGLLECSSLGKLQAIIQVVPKRMW